MRPLILGVDPGKSGAMTVGFDVIDEVIAFVDEGLMAEEIVVRKLRGEMEGFKVVAWMERVQGCIGPHQPGKTMFEFGRNYGFYFGCFASLGIPVHLVTPPAWMKWYKLTGKKKTFEKPSQWKKHLAELARQRNPLKKFTQPCADSVLIWEYGVNEEVMKLKTPLALI